MSAFIVEDETINRIVAFLVNAQAGKKFWLTAPLNDLGYDLTQPMHAKRLAEEMSTLNYQSIEGRYGEGESEEMNGGQPFVYQEISPIRYNRFQVLKSLSCYLYQSCEGDCDKSPLYQALDIIKGALAYEIASDTPEYEAAIWG